MASRFVAFIALVALVAMSTGCSAIGLGVGTAVGASSVRWATVDVDTSPPLSGEAVRARVSLNAPPYEEWVEGTYGGVRNGLLVLPGARGEACERDGPRAEVTTSDEPHDCLIPLQSLLELHAPRGTHWKRGMGIGAAIGGAIDLAVVIALANAFKGPIP